MVFKTLINMSASGHNECVHWIVLKYWLLPWTRFDWRQKAWLENITKFPRKSIKQIHFSTTVFDWMHSHRSSSFTLRYDRTNALKFLFPFYSPMKRQCNESIIEQNSFQDNQTKLKKMVKNKFKARTKHGFQKHAAYLTQSRNCIIIINMYLDPLWRSH